MSSLSTLYQYEMKKIMRRKIFWITLAVCMLCIVFTVTAGLIGSQDVKRDGEVVDSVSYYEMILTDRAYERSLSGRPIDQELLEETMAAYKKIPYSMEFYTSLEEYHRYARPYSAIFNVIRGWTNLDADSAMKWTPSEAALYGMRTEDLLENWQELQLTDHEIAFWQEQEAKLELPFIYQYHDGYRIALSRLLTVGLTMLLFIAICLSGMFSEEHIRRTDQLILSSVNGRDAAYWAKILSGITVAGGGAFVMALAAVGLSMGIYGTDGFQTIIQIAMKQYSWPMTVGEAMLISYGLLLVTAVFMSILVMVGSEVLKSSVAVLAITAAAIVLGMYVSVPDKYRVLAQIWDYLPTNFLIVSNVLDVRPVTIAGSCFLSWQIVPVVYLVAGILTAFAGKGIFRRYQVSGR